MKTLNIVISKIFQVFLIFLLCFIWVRYYEKHLWNAVAISSILTFIIDFIITKLTQKRVEKISLKQSEIKKAESFCNFFIFSNKKESVDFYADFLKTQFPTTKKTDYIIFQNNEEKNILFPFYTFEKISIANIVDIYKKIQDTKPNKVIICGNEFENNVIKFASSLPINFVFLNKYESYNNLFKEYKIYPKNSLQMKTKSSNLNSVFEYALNRKRAKAYIFSSLVLILSSFFVKVSVYYLIISSFLLLLAIFSFTNTKFNKKLPKNIL